MIFAAIARRSRMRWPLVALVALGALLTAACSRPTQPTLALRWEGGSLVGAAFSAADAPQVQVHYTGSTIPQVARRVAERTSALARLQTEEWGRMDPAELLHVWIVPRGQAWPAGLPAPPPGRRARAVGPFALVLTEEGVWDTTAAGLQGAVGLAVTQAEGSPVFAVDWLHEGMGAILGGSWADFPLPQWRATEKRAPGQLYRALSGGGDAAEYRLAAASLAALVIDRWGAGWPNQYPRTIAELTPEAALRWATGVDGEVEALALWQERMEFVLGGSYNMPGFVGSSDNFVPSLADISPVRMAPKLAALPVGPGPNANHSPQNYTIEARYEPAQRTVSGELKLTWQNGEGIPIDTLYFNLWPNAEQYARYGAGIWITSAAVEGQAAPYEALGLDLKLPLGRQVAPGERVEAEVAFETRLPAKITMRVFGQEGAERFNLAHWFPILAPLDDRGWQLTPLPTVPGEPYSENASFQVTLDVPAGTVVGATGTRTGRTEQGGRWLYTYDAPDVKDWVATGGQGLTELVTEAEGVTIRTIDRDPAWAKQAGEVTARTLALFERTFGPYPYPELVVACCARLEYPGLFYAPQVEPSGWWMVTIYHELAHQWFYGVVGSDQYGEPWMDEAFARYGERLAVRTLGPQQNLLDLGVPVREFKRGTHVSSSSLDFTYTGEYGTVVYNKGALALEDLERLTGEAAFARLLQEWVRQMQFRTATAADFVRLAEEISGRELDRFFAEHSIFLSDRGPYQPLISLGQVKP